MPDSSPPIESEDDGANDEGTDLQFDHAELTTPVAAGPSCDACKRPISDAYYEINGKVLCTSCRQQIEASFRGGSGLGRFSRAVVFGSGAALAGAVLYYIVSRVTGANWGIVAILVGFMVGGAVRKGTGNRGGILYQFLSVLLTYFAIGLMIVSLVFGEQLKGARQHNQPAKAVPEQVVKNAAKGAIQPDAAVVVANEGDRAKGIAPPKQSPVTDPPAKVEKGEKKDIPTVENKKDAAVDAEEETDIEAPWLGWLAFGVLITTFICIFPVINAIHAPISGLIYCFALWQAWQMNKPARIVFNGPFQVASGKASASGIEAYDDVG